MVLVRWSRVLWDGPSQCLSPRLSSPWSRRGIGGLYPRCASDRTTPKLSPTNVALHINLTETLLSNGLGPCARPTWCDFGNERDGLELSEQAAEIPANRLLLCQVIANLMTNARASIAAQQSSTGRLAITPGAGKGSRAPQQEVLAASPYRHVTWLADARHHSDAMA